MPSSEDYIGLSFGSFLIEGAIGSGREAEVFRVVNAATGRRYAMRLDGDDADIWAGAEPVNPPRNLSLEARNVRGSWFGTIHYEESAVVRNRRWFKRLSRALGRGQADFRIKVPRIYGVRDLRYLIPVSSPYRLKGSLDVERFLDLAPPDDLHLFDAWEKLVFAMLGDAYAADVGELPGAAWTERWGLLAGGDILARALARYMEGGSLSRDERRAVLARVAGAPPLAPELAENLLLRACGAIERGRITLPAAKRMVEDRFFRENLTRHEVVQIIACLRASDELGVFTDDTAHVLHELLSALSEQPPDPWNNRDAFDLDLTATFEDFIEGRKVGRFTLFLQDLAGCEQDYMTVEGTP